MKIWIFICISSSLLLGMVTSVLSQQCRIIRETSSCSGTDEVIAPGSAQKGEKGNHGLPGKAGPRGPKGPIGSRGSKGDIGPLANMDSFVKEMRNFVQEMNNRFERELQEIKANLSSLNLRLEEHSLRDCAGNGWDGLQTLRSGEKVFCSSGWTVFQRRDGSIFDFHNKTWNEYANGFGELAGEFWLGLKKLQQITRRGGCRLRVDLWSWEDEHAYAEYSQFSVASEENQFRVTVGGYSGTAGIGFADSRHSMNGMVFTTIDRDNDDGDNNCAGPERNRGGWWHRNCGYANPNAIYGRSKGTWNALVWDHWKGLNSLKSTELNIRCD